MVIKLSEFILKWDFKVFKIKGEAKSPTTNKTGYIKNQKDQINGKPGENVNMYTFKMLQKIVKY